MAGRSDEAAYASNWRTVLLVDLVLGLGGLVAGIAIAARGNAAIGSIVVGAGAAYVVLTIRRSLRWKRLREAGPAAPSLGD